MTQSKTSLRPGCAVIALALTLLAPLVVPVPGARAENAPPFTTTMIEGGGGMPVALTVGGNADGPGILFVHGFMASTLHWQKQMTAALADDFRLAFIDMRGHGASSKPAQAEHYLDPELFAADIAAAIQAAGLDRPLLVGWSYGGLFIMDYLRHFPGDTVSGVVLAGSTAGLLPPPPPPPDSPERQARIERSRSPNLMTISAWTDGFLGFLTRDGTLTDAEMNSLRTSAMLVPHYVRRALRERPVDNSDMPGKLQLPFLLISGSEDVSAKPGDMAAVAELLPNAKLHSYEGVGPMTFWYQADRFNADIADFARSLR